MEQSPTLEDCIKLLKGERDEQRLAGLLLATKFCNNDDHDSIIRIYHAVGDNFLDRLLRTGMGRGAIKERNDNQDAYLQLSMTILAAFCRVTKIASSRDMLAKIPLMLEIMSKEIMTKQFPIKKVPEFLKKPFRKNSHIMIPRLMFLPLLNLTVNKPWHNMSSTYVKNRQTVPSGNFTGGFPRTRSTTSVLFVFPLSRSGSSLTEESFEFLLLVSAAHEDGVSILYESGAMNMLASKMPTLPDGSHMVELSIRLLQLIMSKMSLETIDKQYSSELSLMVATLAKQFALSHTSLKFELLHLLSAILSSMYSTSVHEALRSITDGTWSIYIRVGVVSILQNRVAPEQKLEALILADSLISIVGEKWLIGQMNLMDTEDHIPADRCILLVLESSRVEIAVLLNDLAYLKYEKSDVSPNDETFLLKQRNLGIAFSLVEKIIKLISNIGENESDIITDKMFTKIITGLNETIGVVLDYLQDAKDHQQHKGNDLLASVRIIGSYLAETPFACQEKVRELLGYMLLIEGADERSPHSSASFLLPMLCQVTMDLDGCKVVASSGAYKAVVDCLIRLVGVDIGAIEDNGTIFLACDTILNLLLKRDRIGITLDDTYFFRLLGELSHWAENTGDCSNIMMASSICALILDSTSETTLLHHPCFGYGNLTSLSQLFRRSFAIGGKDTSDEAKEVADLHHICVSGYVRWADRFPHIKEAIERQRHSPLQT